MPRSVYDDFPSPHLTGQKNAPPDNNVTLTRNMSVAPEPLNNQEPWAHFPLFFR